MAALADLEAGGIDDEVATLPPTWDVNRWEGINLFFGGVQAVTWTDVKIMVLIVFGMGAGAKTIWKVISVAATGAGWVVWARRMVSIMV